jgi:two-component system chemotaxis sensor kinase CheA
MNALLHRLVPYLVLPQQISTFEASYLRGMNRSALVFLAIHIPAFAVFAWLNDSDPWFATALTTATFLGPAVAYRRLANLRAVSITCGVAEMLMGGVLVHIGQGPVQIEMHFYFFVVIAMLVMFGNPTVIVTASVTVVLHHVVLWGFLPSSLFNYGAPLWVLTVHTAFIVLEATAACFIARSFFDNVIGLDEIVRARTAELAERNRDMRCLLDNVVQGFATLDRTGTLAKERSRMLDVWLGLPDGEVALLDAFERVSPAFAERWRVGWAEVIAGVMPLELTLEQMPRELDIADTHYRVDYRPIGLGEEPNRFMVVVTDVTADLRRERAECQRREAMRIFERLLVDRGAVQEFFEDTGRSVRLICHGADEELAVLNRVLHTLKGNSAIFGLQSLVALAHELESYVTEAGCTPPATETARLAERWDELSSDFERLVGVRRPFIELEELEYRALEQGVREGEPPTTLLRRIRALRLEPTRRHLDRLGEQVRHIGARLAKDVDATVADNGLRLDPKRWSPFWSAFIHAVRNAVDHGVESRAERRAHGKPERAHVVLQTYLRDDRFVVEISDDGRGIDWQRIAREAASMGLAASTKQELHMALFADGVTTAGRVTDISGRGVGLGAVRDATRALGGEIEIETTARVGTTIRMTFARDAMSSDMVECKELLARATG